ncbi:toll/interleukin-1 receptor domain-containing protein [Wenjunlia tyrosinilytica]|uniref:TIR domain-containing protein n=1 Tax=Wenjunlia tyrosinilytica TaxID=1544741 RepID=A0A918DW14_9ACTN|nr:toll/interleukin-1 receptor domain-containing protein [Wenjunlia tyrosinilytica]GGO84234.1 hypothetical protein GCM10012280_15240 [Wenjunlia tyrosinilytica]
MAKPRVFVSHSSNSCDCAGNRCGDYRDAVVELVRDCGCVPVHDGHLLDVGDDWHAKVMAELLGCEGAAIVLSPHALKSPNVMEEALVAIALHEATGGRFRVMVVTLPSTSRRDLKGSLLERLNLRRFDMADWKRDAGPGRPPQRLRNLLEPLAEEYGALPFPRVTEFIAELIKGLAPPVLLETAQLLKVAAPTSMKEHLRYVVSAGLLSERPVEGLGAECALREALGRFLYLLTERERRQEIVDVVVPFARVPTAAARQLHALVEASRPQGRVALLSAQWPATADMYVRRASEMPTRWVMHKPVALSGARFTEELVEDIAGFLSDKLCHGMPCGAEDLRRVMARHEKEKGPITIVLHLQPDPELLRTLVAEFPGLLFVFVHSRLGPGEAATAATHLQSMPLGQEQDMLMTHHDFSG